MSIPLKGVSPSKVDIAVQGFVLKVNYNPYLLDLTLSHEIDSLKHKATVNKRGDLRIELFKKEANVIWTSLEADVSAEELQKRRQESVLVDEALNKDLQVQRADARIAEEKYSLRKQMALDEAERNRLDQIKLDEKQAAEKEVYAAFNDLERREAEKTKKKLAKDKHSDVSIEKRAVDKSLYDIDEDEEEDPAVEAEAVVKKKSEPLVTDASADLAPDKVIFNVQRLKSEAEVQKELNQTASEHLVEEEEEDVRYIPPPRQSASGDVSGGNKVGIVFTPRAFPTPMRESKAAEEEDWVARNRKHLKKHGVLGKNVSQSSDVSEEDPNWLKAKGDDFVRYGDYRSAINAYTAAIEADEKMVSCYSNRSICYLKTHMLVIGDCFWP